MTSQYAVGLDNATYLGLWTPYVSWSVHNAASCMVISSQARDWCGWKVNRDGNSDSTVVSYQVVWLIRQGQFKLFIHQLKLHLQVHQSTTASAFSFSGSDSSYHLQRADKGPDLMSPSLSSPMMTGSLCLWIPVHHYSDHSFTYLANRLLTYEGIWPGLKIHFTFWILPSRQNLNVALPFMWRQGSSWNLGGMVTRVDQNWQVIQTEGTGESDEQTGWSL